MQYNVIYHAVLLFQISSSEMYMGVNPKIGGKPPKWMVYMENPIYKMDDLGGFPIFLWKKTHVSCHIIYSKSKIQPWGVVSWYRTYLPGEPRVVLPGALSKGRSEAGHRDRAGEVYRLPAYQLLHLGKNQHLTPPPQKKECLPRLSCRKTEKRANHNTPEPTMPMIWQRFCEAMEGQNFQAARVESSNRGSFVIKSWTFLGVFPSMFQLVFFDAEEDFFCEKVSTQ